MRKSRLLVFLLLLFTTAVVCAQEKIYFNARIFTADVNRPYAEAIALNGKVISMVGSLHEVRQAAGPGAELIDCQGKFLMPGFIDSHIHAISGGRGLTKANTSDRTLSVAELVAYASDVSQKKEGLSGDVLVVYGINISTWSYLDDISRQFNSGIFVNQPVVLAGSDGHTLWANKAMMKRAGLDKKFISGLAPDQRIFYGIGKDGEPNGFTSEDGQRVIRNVIPKDPDFFKAALKAMEYCNRMGITGILDPTAGNTDNKEQKYLDAYAWLLQNNQLTTHVAATITADPDAEPKPQLDVIHSLQKKYNGPSLNIIGLKVFADGVIEHPTHTAALSLPYAGTSSHGVLMFDPAKFSRLATMADQENLLVHVHAIGDKAVTETLNVFDLVRKSNGNSRLAHSITHLQIVVPTDFDRFRSLNVLASYQLLWAFGDVTTIDIVKPYIDPSLFRWQYPARSMMQAGAVIAGASDWPVSNANPFEAIYNAETRLGPLGVLDSTQCMPREAMLYTYTINAARVMLAEKTIGSLEPGKSADMILLDRDVLTVSPAELKNTKVVWTVFEGRTVYKK